MDRRAFISRFAGADGLKELGHIEGRMASASHGHREVPP
jgi:hypothetical protein